MSSDTQLDCLKKHSFETITSVTIDVITPYWFYNPIPSVININYEWLSYVVNRQYCQSQLLQTIFIIVKIKEISSHTQNVTRSNVLCNQHINTKQWANTWCRSIGWHTGTQGQKQIFCTVLLNRLTWQAHFQLCVSLQAACTVYYIHEMDGSPSEGHPVATEPLTELLWLSTQLLQLLFILQINVHKWYCNIWTNNLFIFWVNRDTMTTLFIKLLLLQHLTPWRPCMALHILLCPPAVGLFQATHTINKY